VYVTLCWLHQCVVIVDVLVICSDLLLQKLL
jgi:hypothetical protein